jgi:hypothetical protein
MREMSMMSPQEIATKYGGDKRKIAQAVQNGLLDPTAAAMAGMLIDRIRAAATQEQQPQTTVAEDALGGRPMPYGRPEVPSGGVAALPVDEDMYNMAGGGIVAFAGEDGSEVDLNEITSQINQASGRGMEGNLGRAREFVDIYREMVSGAKRGPAYEEAKKFYEGAQERASKAAEKQKWTTGLLAASELLSTRGPFSKAVGAAGKVAAPGLQKALDMETAGQEIGLKGRLGLEEKERAEELEAIKGGMSMYGKEQERLISAGKDLAMDKYAKNFVAAAQSDPKLKTLPTEVLEQMGRREYLNLSGASLMRGQAALGGVGVSAGQLERQTFGDARTKVENRIKGDFRLRNRLSKLERENPAAYEAEIDRMIQAELGRAAGGSPAPAPAPTADLAPPSPKKGNAMFPARGESKFEVKTPDGRTFTFPDQKAADAFKARIGAK